MLSGLFKTEVRAQATPWGTWQGDTPAQGVDVNQTTAMQLLAVAGCVRYISDTISTLPVDVYRELPDGTRVEEKVPGWIKEPTVDLDWTAWCSQILTSLLLHGNAYYVVTRNGASIVEMIPVDPLSVTVKRENGRKVYVVAGRVFNGEMRHIKAMMLPGTDVGLSPLEYARRSIGIGLAAVDYGQDNFESFLNMPGVIEMQARAEPAIMRETAQQWRRMRSGRKNRGLPGVLQDGATWKPTGVTNEQAQFLQTRQWTAAEIAGQVFLIDPTEMGIPVTGTSIQYGNMEQRSIASFRRGFQPLVIRIEKSVSALLPQPRYVKLNVDGLLRPDSAARWNVYKIAADINQIANQIGQPPVMTTPEMRDFEDLSVIKDAPAPPAPVQTNSGVPDMHFHLPDSLQVDLHQQAPVVNVAAPTVNVPAPIVNVRAPDVNVEPPVVNVAAPHVIVESPQTVKRTTVRTVERDPKTGLAVRIRDEEL